MLRRVLAVFAPAVLLVSGCVDDDDRAMADEGDGAPGVVEVDGEGVGGGEGSIADSGDPLRDADADTVSDATYTEIECPFGIDVPVEVDCGVLNVPESRQGLSDARIELAVAVLRTPAPDPAPDPVVFLAGGPGGVAVAEHGGWIFEFDEWEFHAVLSSRDLILVDQRGVGFSEPALRCDEDEPDCAGRLEADGVTLAAYTTPENAADIAALRVAMGYEEWNLYGSSYGTRLALVTLRDHPEGVRSVLLEGVYPPNMVPAYHEYIPNSLRAIEVLAEECRRQPACDEAYGDITELVVEALEAAESGASAHGAVDLHDAMFSAMYSMPTVSIVPLALALAADGQIDEAIELLTGDDPEFGEDGFLATRLRRIVDDAGTFSDGFFHAVECREEHEFTEVEVLEAQAEQYLEEGWDPLLVEVLLAGALEPVEEVCPLWSTGTSARSERDPVVSDVPTLLLSGNFDPITPPSWGDLAARTLSRSTHVVVPTLSHSLVNVDQCIDDIVIEFLADPLTELDRGCVATMPPVSLILP